MMEKDLISQVPNEPNFSESESSIIYDGSGKMAEVIIDETEEEFLDEELALSSDKDNEVKRIGKLRTDNLVKKYGKRTVVDHVSIDVKQGEIVGLLGPNGAGKTTTFYMTVGLISPNSGRIYLDDKNITKKPVYRRARLGIGYLAQEASVFRKLSVENNIRAVLEMTKLTKAAQRERLDSAV